MKPGVCALLVQSPFGVLYATAGICHIKPEGVAQVVDPLFPRRVAGGQKRLIDGLDYSAVQQLKLPVEPGAHAWSLCEANGPLTADHGAVDQLHGVDQSHIIRRAHVHSGQCDRGGEIYPLGGGVLCAVYGVEQPGEIQGAGYFELSDARDQPELPEVRYPLEDGEHPLLVVDAADVRLLFVVLVVVPPVGGTGQFDLLSEDVHVAVDHAADGEVRDLLHHLADVAETPQLLGAEVVLDDYVVVTHL